MRPTPWPDGTWAGAPPLPRRCTTCTSRRGPTEAQAFAATDQEIDNIRAAATWAAEHGDLDGLRLIGRLLGYSYYQAPVEGGSWADRVLATIPATDPVATAMVLTVQTACAAAAGDTPTALAASAAALGLLRGAGRQITTSLRRDIPRAHDDILARSDGV